MFLLVFLFLSFEEKKKKKKKERIMGSSGGRGVIIHLFFFCCFGLLVKGEVRKWDKGRLGGLLERYPNFHKSQMELREKGEGGEFVVWFLIWSFSVSNFIFFFLF